MLELELPYPPSINHYWRRMRNRMVISKEGRKFRAAVVEILASQQVAPQAGPLEVEVDVFPPDNRRRDIDNVQKALLDALQHGGAYADDSQVDDLLIHRREVVAGGMVQVRVAPCARSRGPIPLAKPRSCLKCGETFDSSGPGNRICPPCQRSNARLRLDESELQKQRGVKRHNGELLPNDLEALT